MKIIYWKPVSGNFGDDMNDWFWDALLSDIKDDRMYFIIGIGTLLGDIISDQIKNTGRQKKIVIGAGYGYGISENLIDPNANDWKFYCVRGPLTANYFNLDEKLSASDPAIMIPDLLPTTDTTHNEVAFVPHWETADYSQWEKATKLAGLRYIDPRNSSKAVIREIAGCKLVLAESLHAAIIADSYRIPWIGIRTSEGINNFKWRDWCASIGVTYEPVRLTALERLTFVENAGKQQGLNLVKNVVERFIPSRFRRKIRSSVLLGLRKFVTPNSFENAVKQLHKQAVRGGFLSSDGEFQSARGKFMAAIEMFKKDLREDNL